MGTAYCCLHTTWPSARPWLHPVVGGPWLAPVYQHLFSAAHPCTVLPIRTWCFLLSAFFLSLVPAKPRLVPLPHTMPIVYSDAAPCGDSFVVACCRPGLAASVASTPGWVASVQDAKLYGVFHSLRQCALRRLSHCCILTDNAGVYYTLSFGRVSASTPARSRIFRRIIRVCLEFGLQFQISWVPSCANAADAFSRPFQNALSAAISASQPWMPPMSRCLPATLYHRCGFAGFPSA